MAKSKVLIENDKTIVTEWSFDVGDSTGLHTHEYNYIVVPMLDGESVSYTHLTLPTNREV